jgi:hypothetical protein
VERTQARQGLHPELLPVVDQILHSGPQDGEADRFYEVTPLRRKPRGSMTPKTPWRLYGGK